LLMLAAYQSSDSPWLDLLIKGMLDSQSTTSRRPVKFANEPAGFTLLHQRSDPRIAQIGSLITWPGKPGAKPELPLKPLTAEQQARFEMGKALFLGSCAACHQPHGRGMEGLAPPLADSEWVLGPEQRLVRIALHGVMGPLKVRGRTYHLDMPAMGFFNDEQLAAILTYLRREWEHTADPVEPETVKAIRNATNDHHEAWLGEQLIKIP
jgi:mono/diheme cytochrome c family protein